MDASAVETEGTNLLDSSSCQSICLSRRSSHARPRTSNQPMVLRPYRLHFLLPVDALCIQHVIASGWRWQRGKRHSTPTPKVVSQRNAVHSFARPWKDRSRRTERGSRPSYAKTASGKLDTLEPGACPSARMSPGQSPPKKHGPPVHAQCRAVNPTRRHRTPSRTYVDRSRVGRSPRPRRCRPRDGSSVGLGTRPGVSRPGEEHPRRGSKVGEA